MKIVPLEIIAMVQTSHTSVMRENTWKTMLVMYVQLVAAVTELIKQLVVTRYFHSAQQVHVQQL